MLEPAGQRRLLPGDWVQVRAAEHILATLDDRGELAGLPFMPEMLAFAGQTFRVLRRAQSVCATQDVTAIRRLSATVHLENLRCDGSYHGHCQSGCLIFWKEDWLERTLPPTCSNQSHTAQSASQSQGLLPILEKWATTSSEWSEKGSCYQCQATQLWQASQPLSVWDFRQYFREISANGTAARRVVGSILGSVWRKLRQKLVRNPQRVPAGNRTPTRELNLQVGELIEVCSAEQIATTLDARNKNRGLWFDPQMVQYCGRQFRVAARIERILEESTGRLMELQSPAVSLEAVGCDGCWHRFCSREAPLFWREIWLQRVEPATPPSKVSRSAAGSPENAPTPAGVQG